MPRKARDRELRRRSSIGDTDSRVSLPYPTIDKMYDMERESTANGSFGSGTSTGELLHGNATPVDIKSSGVDVNEIANAARSVRRC